MLSALYQNLQDLDQFSPSTSSCQCYKIFTIKYVKLSGGKNRYFVRTGLRPVFNLTLNFKFYDQTNLLSCSANSPLAILISCCTSLCKSPSVFCPFSDSIRSPTLMPSTYALLFGLI